MPSNWFRGNRLRVEIYVILVIYVIIIYVILVIYHYRNKEINSVIFQKMYIIRNRKAVVFD